MKTTTYTCDRCGKESPEPFEDYVSIETKGVSLYTRDTSEYFCDDCICFLYENLNRIFSEWRATRINSSPKDKFIMRTTKKPNKIKMLVDTLKKDFIGSASYVCPGRTEDNINKIYIEGYFDEKTLIKMASSILTILEGA